MAGIGEWNSLSKSDLKRAFEEAKTAGADYLVHFYYTSEGRPMTMRGVSFKLDMIDLHEGAQGIHKNNAEEALKAIHDKYGTLKIQSVYPVIVDQFEDAAKGGETLLPPKALANVRAAIEREEERAAMAARPLWKKILGLNP